jgi:type IV secretory pathway TrbL component
VLLFGITVLALAWFAPMLASEVVQGQPHLSGSDAVRTAVGAGFTTIGGAMLTNMAIKNMTGMVAGGARAAGRIVGGRRGGGGGGRGSSGGGRPPQINYSGMQPRPAGLNRGKP